MNVFYLFLLVALLYLLNKATGMVVKGTHRIHYQVRLSELLTSFILLGLITSIPEFFVAVMSAVKHEPELSLGNLLGAGVVVLTLLIGISTLRSGSLSIRGRLNKNDFLLSLLVMGLPALVVLDGVLSRFDGFFLFLSFLALTLHLYRKREAYTEEIVLSKEGPMKSPLVEFGNFLLAGVLLLVVSYFLVETSLRAAVVWGVPVFAVGLLLISVGTNVPELGFVFNSGLRSSRAARDITTGILFGNVVANTAALGVLGVLEPFVISDLGFVRGVSALFILSLLLVWWFMNKDRKLSWKEGLLLLVVYAVFVAYSFTALFGV